MSHVTTDKTVSSELKIFYFVVTDVAGSRATCGNEHNCAISSMG